MGQWPVVSAVASQHEDSGFEHQDRPGRFCLEMAFHPHQLGLAPCNPQRIGSIQYIMYIFLQELNWKQQHVSNKYKKFFVSMLRLVTAETVNHNSKAVDKLKEAT